ncbi:MAG TPA: hypothetical protein VGU02_00265 [Gaiellaceae bacterium]|nr:hypothetical protein [Gaiellaceae bacterium]
MREVFLAALTVAALALGTARNGTTASSGFPCRWHYNLYVGLHVGYETGGENADCAGRPGTLILAARLYRLTPASRTWRLVRATSHSWTNPTGNRYIEFSEPCVAGRIKAVFTWTLRDPGGRLIGHNTITTSPVNDPGRGCKYILG